VKKQILLPLAVMLVASPVWARQHSGSSIIPSATALSFNGSTGNVSTQTITFTVTGSTPVIVTGISFSNSAFFSSPVSLPITVYGGQSYSGQVSARPQSTAQTGTLTINSSVGTITVALSETAIASAPAAPHDVNLEWQAPASSSDPVDSYEVYRAASGSTSYSVVGTTTAASTSYTDTSVSAGQSYTYEVVSVDENGNASKPSNTVTLSIP
jgi:hypothetical protein